jgi:hypothetical protein
MRQQSTSKVRHLPRPGWQGLKMGTKGFASLEGVFPTPNSQGTITQGKPPKMPRYEGKLKDGRSMIWSPTSAASAKT